MTSEPPEPAPRRGPAAAQEPAQFLRHTLPVGTQIGGLQITGLIGEGGFGIVYLAFDATLQRQVALKEYMPSALASRAANSADVSVKSPRHADTFNAGLRSFVNEARLLAHFDHPALVKVHQFWQANRTAYMAMPYYQGPTLKAHLGALAGNGQAPDEATLREWLAPLLDALELLHAEHCYHRDIAPDNILLTARGPLLLDFGAARRVISDMTHALTVMLKPGYAPIEQYGDAASMAQGPWTDLYALASVVYFAITGHSPITSVERVMGDPLPALASVAAGRYSATFLRAVDAALAVRPKDRPQSVAAFRALLDAAPMQPERETSPLAVAQQVPSPAPPPPASVPPAPMPSVPKARSARRGWLIGGALVAAIAVGFTLAFVARRSGTPDAAAVPGAGRAATTAPAVTPAQTSSPEPSASQAAVPAVASAAPAASAAAQHSVAPAATPPRVAPPRAGRASAPARVAPATAQTASPKAAARPVPAEAAQPRASTPVMAAPAVPRDAVAQPDKAAPAARAEPTAPKASAKPPRCAEILQRGAQQPLGSDDVEFLRKECR